MKKTFKTIYKIISYVAALNSGTVALHWELIILGVQPGDEVICQNMTLCASANPILYQGAVSVFIDSPVETCIMSPIYLGRNDCG